MSISHQGVVTAVLAAVWFVAWTWMACTLLIRPDIHQRLVLRRLIGERWAD